MPVMIRVGEKTVGANSTETVSIDIPTGITFKFKDVHYKSDGTFKITRIYDEAADKHYLSGTLYSDMLKDRNANVFSLPETIELKGPTKLNIEVTDTSGSSNTIVFALFGTE